MIWARSDDNAQSTNRVATVPNPPSPARPHRVIGGDVVLFGDGDGGGDGVNVDEPWWPRKYDSMDRGDRHIGIHQNVEVNQPVLSCFGNGPDGWNERQCQNGTDSLGERPLNPTPRESDGETVGTVGGAHWPNGVEGLVLRRDGLSDVFHRH